MIKADAEVIEIVLNTDEPISQATAKEVATMQVLADMLKNRIESTPQLVNELGIHCPTCEKQSLCKEQYISLNIKAQEIIKLMKDYESVALKLGVEHGRR